MSETLKRRKKYYGQNIRYVKTDKKANVNFTLDELNTLCAYAITINSIKIKKKHLFNMRNLFCSLDMQDYKISDDMYNRVIFIQKAMEARLSADLNDPNLIISYVNGGFGEKDLVDRLNFNQIKLSNQEIDYINNVISNCLKYNFIYDNIDDTIKACTKFKSEDFDNKADAAAEFSNIITKTYNDMVKANADNEDELTFSLKGDKLSESISEVKRQISNPSLKLRTCMQGMNELLGGGFEGSRIYMFLGLAGVGKSMTMLNLAYQMKKANKNYSLKDPTKIPAIVYLTMENTVRETIQRLYEMIVGQDKDMTKYSTEDIVNLLKTEGELYLSSESPIDIIIKYKPNNSVDTSYLYELDDDLQSEGYEMICLIQDHIKRIRPVNKSNDLRLDLGETVNEMKVFAQLKDIPVITISHINREGSRKVEEASRVGRQDITKLLGRSTVGESMLMIDNLDGAYILGKEIDEDGNKFLAVNRIKERYKCTDQTYMIFPYEKDNDIRLKEDIGKTRLSKTSIDGLDYQRKSSFEPKISAGEPTPFSREYSENAGDRTSINITGKVGIIANDKLQTRYRLEALSDFKKEVKDMTSIETLAYLDKINKTLAMKDNYIDDNGMMRIWRHYDLEEVNDSVYKYEIA